MVILKRSQKNLQNEGGHPVFRIILLKASGEIGAPSLFSKDAIERKIIYF